MTELRIIRGRDILLYINGEQLYGVTDFHAVSRRSSHEIREYLSGQPLAVVNAGEHYELTLKALSLFRPASTADGFCLKVEDEETVYLYEGCVVTRCERNIRSDKNVTDSYTITAEKMTKRSINDAG